MPEIVLQLSRVLFYLWRWGYIRSMALCGEDSAEIVEVYPFLPCIWEQSSVHTAFHAMPGHCLAPGQGGRQWLKTINDGQHLGPSVCSCQRTHKKPPWFTSQWSHLVSRAPEGSFPTVVGWKLSNKFPGQQLLSSGLECLVQNELGSAKALGCLLLDP